MKTNVIMCVSSVCNKFLKSIFDFSFNQPNGGWFWNILYLCCTTTAFSENVVGSLFIFSSLHSIAVYHQCLMGRGALIYWLMKSNITEWQHTPLHYLPFQVVSGCFASRQMARLRPHMSSILSTLLSLILNARSRLLRLLACRLFCRLGILHDRGRGESQCVQFLSWLNLNSEPLASTQKCDIKKMSEWMHL